MIVIGRAMPVLEADVFAERQEDTHLDVMRKPFGIMFEALDQLQAGEVYICSGSSPRYALWGGLMSTRAIAIGAAGAVVDGFSRDTNEILRLNFPTFSQGTYAQDQGPRGKVIDYRVPIEFGGINVRRATLSSAILTVSSSFLVRLRKKLSQGPLRRHEAKNWSSRHWNRV